MTNAAAVWPSSTMAAAMSAPTCASRAARLEELAHAGVHPVDRRARGAQLGDLGGVLAHPQLGDDRPGQRLRGLRQGLAQPEHVLRGHRVGDREPGGAAGQVADQQVGVLAVVPGDDLDAEVVQRQPGPARRLQPGHDQRGRRAVPGRGQHQAGEPLVAGAFGVEQVAQVRARGDQQQVDAVLGGDVARAPDAVGEQCGGNGRSRGARSHEAQYAPPPCVTPSTRRRPHRAPGAGRHTPLTASHTTSDRRTLHSRCVGHRACVTPRKGCGRAGDRWRPAVALAHCGPCPDR